MEALRVLDGGNAGDWKQDEADITAIDTFRVMPEQGEQLMALGKDIYRIGQFLVKYGARAEFEYKALRGETA